MAQFIGIDWGTSSFRAWLFAKDGRVLQEQRSSHGGMRDVPVGGFPATLRQNLADFPKDLPILMCGMVGARQGWIEAPYVEAPCDLRVVCQHSVTVPHASLNARILPGIAQRIDPPDVMRGEETQLLGLLHDRPGYTGVVCMPGTHAKWVRLENGHVNGFTTVMTGELYAILAEHSLLKHSLKGAKPSGNPASPAFLSGVRRGLAAPEQLSAALFSVRAGDLLHGVEGQAAADTLSGLLIGGEIAGQQVKALDLVASGPLADLYAAAFTVAEIAFTTVDADSLGREGLLYAFPLISEFTP